MDTEGLASSLCTAFCAGIDVHPVPCGMAVASPFMDGSGDRIGFYVVEDPDGYRIEDGGDYLPHLIASGIDIERGARGDLLSAILKAGGGFWDRDTLEIRTLGFPAKEVSARSISLLSALIRVRDLELMTREIVRNTFKEDATAALIEKIGSTAEVESDCPIDSDFDEFPSDIIVRTKSGKSAAVYLVSNNDRLNEALLLHTEAMLRNRHDFSVIALIDDIKSLSSKKYQRAQNRLDATSLYRGDERAAIEKVFRAATD